MISLTWKKDASTRSKHNVLKVKPETFTKIRGDKDFINEVSKIDFLGIVNSPTKAPICKNRTAKINWTHRNATGVSIALSTHLFTITMTIVKRLLFCYT